MRHLTWLAVLGSLLLAALPEAPPTPPDVDPRIEAIVRPLAHAPTFVESDEAQLTLEFAPDHVAEGTTVEVALVPSFGAVRTATPVGAAVTQAATSGLWPGRDITVVTLEVDDLGPGLYDVTVAWAGGEDLQRRAVSVVDEFPASPRVVVIADPSVGDPRPIQEGVEEFQRGDTDDLAYRTEHTVGDPIEGDRWEALNRVIDEVNLARPDAVLLTGDLTFAVHPRAMPYEYEDAWRILDRLEVPSFAAPGNHDLYELDYVQAETGAPGYFSAGAVEWQRYFGPLYYSVDIGPEFHLTSLNTFDWEDLRPFPPPDFGTRSGGRIGDTQLAWLSADLAAYRASSPEGAIVSIAHHDPSWLSRRHPWPERDNRDVVRELFAEHDVWVHFAGHTHEDRVARYFNPDAEAVGSIVETNGRQHLADDYPLQQLHYLDWSEGDRDPGTMSQDELAKVIREPDHGPLFVTTTTAASGLIGEDWGLGGYWGWRLAHLEAAEGGGYDPADLGYATTADTDDVRAFLDAWAERPEHWNAAHAPLGVFSVPSYHLDADPVPAAGTEVGRTVRSRLLQPMEVTLRLVVRGEDVEVSGGELVAERGGDGLTDVWVRAVVPAEGEITVSARAGD